MSKEAAILTSDWHLAKHAWAKYSTLAGDSYYGLEQIVNYACDKKLPILAAGDLFDKQHPDSHSVFVAASHLDKLIDHELVSFFTQGQHEYVKDDPWMLLSVGTVHIHKRAVELKSGIRVYGLDYTRPDTLQNELDDVPVNTDVLVMHQVWQNFMGECRKTDGHFDMIKTKIKVLLTGDFHQSIVIPHTTPELHKFTVVSPGSTCMQSIDEQDDKYFFVLHDDMSIKRHKLKARKLFRFVVETSADLERLLDHDIKPAFEKQTGVPDYIAKNIIDVKFHTSIPDAYNRIEAAVSTRAHLFLRPIKIKPKAEDLLINEQRKALIRQGLKGCLKLMCEPGSEEYKISLRFLDAADPAKEIGNFIKEYIENDPEASSIH